MKYNMLLETIFIGYLSCCQLYVCNLYLVVTPVTEGTLLFHCTRFCLCVALLNFNSLGFRFPREGQSCCKSSDSGLRTGNEHLILWYSFLKALRKLAPVGMWKLPKFSLKWKKIPLNCCFVGNCESLSACLSMVWSLFVVESEKRSLMLGSVMVILLYML